MVRLFVVELVMKPRKVSITQAGVARKQGECCHERIVRRLPECLTVVCGLPGFVTGSGRILFRKIVSNRRYSPRIADGEPVVSRGVMFRYSLTSTIR